MTEILNLANNQLLIYLDFLDVFIFKLRRWICACDFILKKRMTAVLRALPDLPRFSSTGFATLPAQDFSDFLFPRIFQFLEERFSGFEEKDFVAWDRGWRWWSQRTPGRNILSPTKQKETIKTRQINHPGKAGDLSKSSTQFYI